MQKMFTRMLLMVMALTMVITAPVSASVLPVNEPNPAAVKAAVSEFNNLSKKEKKARVKEVQKVMKQYAAEKAAGKAPSTNTLLLVILALLLPPLAVFLHEGELNSKFWISLLLTLLFFIPGVIYALIVVLGS